MKAILALEDGRYFEGESFGAEGERMGEVVFNTGMTGYQEVLTDPSYKGQIVVMTYPLIGNYGVNDNDSESRSLWLEGFAINELSRRASNYRSAGDLDSYLRKHGVPGIQGIDTRALTRHIREAGAMRAVLSTGETDPQKLVARAKESPGLVGRDLVSEVTSPVPYDLGQRKQPIVAVLDFGVKFSILRLLHEAGCHVKILNAASTADDIVRLNPDGVLLSNGPGDPAAVTYAIETVRNLIGLKTMPLFGICLGHQLMGLALGGKTYKLKFGHHGSNHPVKDLATGKIHITVQNHGFCVDENTLDINEIEVTHMNLYDGTLEGIRHRSLPIFSVQFHPEAGPGPHDARSLFSCFIEQIKKSQEEKKQQR
ncbi:MAG: glutamine-hydrolyzing carbamoyl-phosphate synthase small subunit [Syntrophales bacterium]|jgi:carbamoyl-phosphate synthase small subunit|nr:glutamine-hydrolyzing carbamoyl-phosphate synthase small subunit [Syntrophales bacterium]